MKKKVQKTPITLETLDTRMDSLDSRMDKLDTRMDSLEEKIDSVKYDLERKIEKELRDQDERARQYRDDVLTKMDEFMGKIEDEREEKIINDYQVKERFDNHEERLKKLETSKSAIIE